MNQDNLRQQVFFMKRMKSYSEIAKAIGVKYTSFYSWLEGNFSLKEETAEELQRFITNTLLENTPGSKKYNTVKNLINLLGEYHFDDGEILAELPQYDSNVRYYVSNYGRVFSLCGKDWIIKTPQHDEKGYLYVDLYCKGDKTRKRIHQIVVEAFMPYTDLDGMEIHHLDENKDNNHLDNLIPLTPEQHRMIHKYIRKWREIV